MCKAALSNWKPSDEPMKRHQEEYNECPLVVLDNKLGNVKTLNSARRKTFSTWWPHKSKDFLAVPTKVMHSLALKFNIVGERGVLLLPY
jgi:hypothetical protein